MASNPFEIFNAVPTFHRDKLVSSLFTSLDFSDFMENLENNRYRVAIIPEGMTGRPDLLALQVYGDESLWWAIMLANRIDDAKTELVAGRKVFVPEIPGVPFNEIST